MENGWDRYDMKKYVTVTLCIRYWLVGLLSSFEQTFVK